MTTLSEHKALLNELGKDRCNSYLAQTVIVALRDVIEHLAATPKVTQDEYTLELELSNQTHLKRILELENTIKQLKSHNDFLKGNMGSLQKIITEQDTRISVLKKENDWLKGRMSARDDVAEQSGCRKDDTQDGGWIPWSGGKRPVAGDTEVFVRYRGFDHVDRLPHQAFMFLWNHDQGRADIVAYRIAE